MQQTMLRVKDPVKSLDFYTRILGMRWVPAALSSDRFQFPFFLVYSFPSLSLCSVSEPNHNTVWSVLSSLLQKFDFPSMRFSLYFLGFEDKKEIPSDVKERTAWTFSRRATIELTQWVLLFMSIHLSHTADTGHVAAVGIHYCKCSLVNSNWGSETDDSQSYHNGNSDPRGFGEFLYLHVVFYVQTRLIFSERHE